MRALIVLAYEVPQPDDVADVLRTLNPPATPYFLGRANIVVEPHAARLLEWLNASSDPAIPDYSSTEAAGDLAAGIISDYIATGCATADSGTPDGRDAATWSAAIAQLRHLHLAEPHLPAQQILSALRLLGWTDPESSI